MYNRYTDAYRVANITESIGKITQGIGAILGIIVLMAILSSRDSLGGASWIIGIVVALIVGGAFFLMGIFISASGQILRATLDSAVNTSPLLSNDEKAMIMSVSPAVEGPETEYYSRAGVRVTNKRLVVPPNTWSIAMFQTTQVEKHGGKFIIRLLDRSGQQVHFLESDNEERIHLIADAINKALSGKS